MGFGKPTSGDTQWGGGWGGLELWLNILMIAWIVGQYIFG